MIHYANDKISERLLGNYDPKIKFCVITPISSMFNSIVEKLDIIDFYTNGFYRNCVVDSKFGKCAIIETPQGIQCQDVIYAFEDSKFIFLGFAGSVHQDLQIGEIIEASNSFDEFGNSYSLNPFTSFKKENVGYSPALVGAIAEEFQDKAKQIGCKMVDMETTYCTKAVLQTNGNSISALYVITDTEEIQFYDVDEQNAELTLKSTENMLDYIVNYLRG